jgi:peroxiredoxin Q/BCP
VVEEGKPAPAFELTTDSGDTIRLADPRWKQVVLYFYPRDDTPGCTKQACGIRDAWDAFRATGAEVFGVSPDGEASHRSSSRSTLCLSPSWPTTTTR